jgi:hypothetical protein
VPAKVSPGRIKEAATTARILESWRYFTSTTFGRIIAHFSKMIKKSTVKYLNL